MHLSRLQIFIRAPLKGYRLQRYKSLNIKRYCTTYYEKHPLLESSHCMRSSFVNYARFISRV